MPAAHAERSIRPKLAVALDGTLPVRRDLAVDAALMPAVEGEHSRQARAAPDDDAVEIDDAEDVQPMRLAPDPKLPSAEEVEEHRCMHIPYRDW